jgi:hypothetical protein
LAGADLLTLLPKEMGKKIDRKARGSEAGLAHGARRQAQANSQHLGCQTRGVPPPAKTTGQTGNKRARDPDRLTLRLERLAMLARYEYRTRARNKWAARGVARRWCRELKPCPAG